MKQFAEFTSALEKWFQTYGRHDLPWREDFDPYKVWVSEIMLQQTQVPRVKDRYYPRFLAQFPTVEDLAKANWKKVFPVWQGLGYYSRGKNMIRAAQMIVSEFGGEFPTDPQQLEKLPGVGKYTAAAIASFSFDTKIPAIDTNIHKIVTTLWPETESNTTAQELINHAKSGRDWNSAMMDLATALRAKQEIAGDLGTFFPEDIRKKFIPVRAKKTAKKKPKSRKKTIQVGVACIYQDGKYLIQTRPEDKSFTGMWEFPGGKREKGEDFRGCVKREIQEEIGVTVSVRPPFFEEVHEFEHVNLQLRFHRCQIQAGTPQPLENQKLDWVAPQDFGKIDFLKTNANALERLKKIRV